MNINKDRLECTGERLIEDEYKSSESRYLIYLFHIATYNFCLPYVRGKKVLDFGSGSGYGTHLIANECAHITGIDISGEAVDFANSRYRANNLDYVKIDKIETKPLPFDDNTFDTVISFQVIEHIHRVDLYLREIKRVLKPAGTLIIATPDRKTRLFPGQRPWNIYHIYEYSPESFIKAVSPVFPETTLYGMSGKPGVIDIEIKRTDQLRLATYIFTFPFCPEWYRQLTLKMLKFAGKTVASLFSKNTKGSEIEQNFNFDIHDITIEKNIGNSVNIVSISINNKNTE